MGVKIIIENLPPDLTKEGLRGIFDQIGEVESVKINTELLTRRPKGSGYVEMSLDVDAFRAINCFNGASIKNKKVSLKEVQPLLKQAKYILKRTTSLQFLTSNQKEKALQDQ